MERKGSLEVLEESRENWGNERVITQRSREETDGERKGSR